MLLFLLTSAALAQTHYFPPQAFCDAGETEHCERWYVPHLVAMKEPSLWETSKKQSNETYRFLWLRTFHHPVAARLEIRADRSGELFVKVLSGAGGYEPGHLIRNQSHKIDKQLVDIFLKLLDQADFWTATTEQEQTDVVNLDGAQWIMEGTKDGQYHVVDRWSPKEGPYRKAALFLAIDIGGLNPRYSDVY